MDSASGPAVTILMGTTQGPALTWGEFKTHALVNLRRGMVHWRWPGYEAMS